MNRHIKIIRIYNIYGAKSTGYGGELISPEGLCRCLSSSPGGGGQTFILLKQVIKDNDNPETKQKKD